MHGKMHGKSHGHGKSMAWQEAWQEALPWQEAGQEAWHPAWCMARGMAMARAMARGMATARATARGMARGTARAMANTVSSNLICNWETTVVLNYVTASSTPVELPRTDAAPSRLWGAPTVDSIRGMRRMLAPPIPCPPRGLESIRDSGYWCACASTIVISKIAINNHNQ